MRFLIGPELLWLSFYLILLGFSKMGSRFVKPIDGFIETLWFWIPVMVLLSFSFWWLPFVEKKGLIWRMWMVSLIGGLYIFERIAKAYNKTGPGMGTGYMVCALFIFLALVAGTIVVKLRF
jgi:hypothetical protein